MLRMILPAILLCTSALAQTPPLRQFLLRVEPARKDFTLQSMTEEERSIIGEHVVYPNGLLAAGTMTFAGQAFEPKALFGIIVVKAADAEAANAILKGDPVPHRVRAPMPAGRACGFQTILSPGDPAARQSARSVIRKALRLGSSPRRVRCRHAVVLHPPGGTAP